MGVRVINVNKTIKLAFGASRVEVFRGLDKERHHNCNSLENEILICVSATFNRLSSCHFFIVTISAHQNQLKIYMLFQNVNANHLSRIILVYKYGNCRCGCDAWTCDIHCKGVTGLDLTGLSLHALNNMQEKQRAPLTTPSQG